jgi:hypothetical protein
MKVRLSSRVKLQDPPVNVAKSPLSEAGVARGQLVKHRLSRSLPGGSHWLDLSGKLGSFPLERSAELLQHPEARVATPIVPRRGSRFSSFDVADRDRVRRCLAGSALRERETCRRVGWTISSSPAGEAGRPRLAPEPRAGSRRTRRTPASRRRSFPGPARPSSASRDGLKNLAKDRRLLAVVFVIGSDRGTIARTLMVVVLWEHRLLRHAPGCLHSAGALLPYVGGDRRWTSCPFSRAGIDLTLPSPCPRAFFGRF